MNIEELTKHSQDQRVRRMLDLIASAEGTTQHGYNTAFGGGRFDSLTDHPRTLHDFTQTDGKANKTSAAGRYQFLAPTWDDVSKSLGLSDFGPQSQDIAAVELLRRNGALDALLADDFDTAIKKSGPTWASLPSSPYPQPKRSPGFIAQALDATASAILPSAQAAKPNFFDQFDDEPAAPATGGAMRVEIAHEDPKVVHGTGERPLPLGQVNVSADAGNFFDQFDDEPVANPLERSKIAALGAGLGAGFGETILGAQHYLGRGLRGLGAEGAGQWLVDDAAAGRKKLAGELSPFQENSPIVAGVGELGGNLAVAGPLARGMGAIFGAGSRVAPALRPVADAVASSGMRSAGVGGVGGLAAKTAGGAITGGVTASLVEPGQGMQGALIGGALPGVWQGAANLAPAAVRAIRGAGTVSPEVAGLAQRAQAQGINIRPDQLTQSKPVAALSAALDYLPFSGRQGSLARQQSQFNTAISRTVGESTDNVTQALGNAERRLGAEFDRVLKNTQVNADTQFLEDLARIAREAQSEMSDQQFATLSRQMDNILGKIQPGDVIDADAAYNVKKALDRVSKSSDTTLAHYGRETRTALMDALNRTLPDGGDAFAQTRQQWGNMSELQGLVPRGAEGSVSAARLANARGIRGNDLGELADIAAQFLKPRIGDSGTAQRAGVYSVIGTGSIFDPVSAGIGLGVGRAANTLLGSPRLANSMVSRSLASTASGDALGPGVRALFPGMPQGVTDRLIDPLISLGLRAAPLVSTGP